MKRSAFKTILFRSIGIISGILLSLFVLEVASKVYHVFSLWKVNRVASKISKVSDIPGVRYEMIPNIKSAIPNKFFKKTPLVSINQYGFRGDYFSAQKAQNTYRIVVLGDSIAFGVFVEQEDIFPSVLQRRMNKGRYRQKVEVINASLSGRDTWEEYALLKYKIIPLAPDLILLQICLNDSFQLPFPRKDAQIGLFNDLVWYRYSSLLRLLDQKITGFKKVHIRWLKKIGIYEERIHFGLPHKDMIDVTPRWEEWSNILLRINKLSLDNDIDLLFVVFPTKWHIKNKRSETIPVLTRFAKRNNIALLDLLGTYSSFGAKRMLRDWTHPRKEGHEIAAIEIERFINNHFLKRVLGFKNVTKFEERI